MTAKMNLQFNRVGDMYLSVLDSAEQMAILRLKQFFDAEDCADAVHQLLSQRDGPEAAMRAFASWLAGEVGFGEQFRRSLEAADKILKKASALGTFDYALPLQVLCPRVFRRPQRRLGRNGGDRRSRSFQRCDTPLHRGTVDYFLARLELHRPDLLKAYQHGELRSVRQAAIAAGFLKPRARKKAVAVVVPAMR